MKLMIVDDEVWMRRGIRSMLADSTYPMESILEAEDGIQALEMMETERPDLVIVDIRMPEMDGLTFIAQAISIASTTKFIIVSGYNDFQYAKEAIKLRAIDYILKPVVREELLAAVDKAMESKRQEEDSRERMQRSEQSASLLQEMQIVEWLQSSASLLDSHPQWLKRNLDDCNTACLSIRVEPDEAGLSDLRGPADIQLGYFILRNYLSDMLSEGNRQSFVFQYQGAFHALWLEKSGAGEQSHLRDELENCAGRIRRFVQRAKFFAVRMGHSGVKTGKSQVHDAFAESVRALKQAIYGEAVSDRVRNPKPWSEKDFRDLVDVGDEEGIRRTLRDCLTEKAREQDFVSGLEQTLEYLWLLLDKWRRELVPDSSSFAPVSEEQKNILNYDHMDHLASFVSEKFVALCREMRKDLDSDGKTAVYRIIDEIGLRYHEDLSLARLSKHHYMNAAYLGNLFKEIAGMSFNSYVTKVRMEKAGELIQQYGVTIGQVARMVGYDDERYFSTVFKKSFGVTPSEYRRLKQGGSR